MSLFNSVKEFLFSVSLKVKLMGIFMGMIMIPLLIFSTWVNVSIDSEFDKLMVVTAEHEQQSANQTESITDKQQNFLEGFKEKLLRNTILILLWSLFLSVVIGLLFTKLLTNPLNELIKAMKQVEKGDLTVRVKTPYKDEIGKVTEGFNHSIDQTVNLISRVIDTAHSVSSASQQLAAGAHDSGRVTDQISGSIQEVAEGAEKQAENVKKTAEVLNEISRAMQEIAGNAIETNNTSEEMMATAKSGGESIHKTTMKMQEIEKVVNESTQVVTVLGQRSQEIGKIIDLIKSIAEQTNLLALNAAIEAARAGEHGRGFAVVAEEVRKLAEGSAKATEDIVKIINEIRAETDKAVEISEQGASVVNEGTQLAAETEGALQEILSAISVTNDKIIQISTASQQVSEGSTQVMSSMNQVSSVAEDTSASSQEVAAAAEEQSASVQEVAASAQQLADIAHRLEDLVQNFKVN